MHHLASPRSEARSALLCGGVVGVAVALGFPPQPCCAGDPLLAAGASAEPFFRLHFLGSLAPIEQRTVVGDKSCIHCTNRAPKRQYTDSFFALCENWGGLYSLPLCRCLSTAPFEASPIVPANVSYWPESVPAMFPGSKLRVRECLKRGNRGLNAFCCIVVWPIKSKLRSLFMQTGNYVVTAAAIDIWLPPHGKRGWGASLSLQALKRWTLMILTENREWISETDRSRRWILGIHVGRTKSQCSVAGYFCYLMHQIFPIAVGLPAL